MALLKCPDCGGNVSDSAPACPHCGRPMSAATPVPPSSPPKAVKPVKKNSGCATFLAGGIALVALYSVFGGHSGGSPSSASAAPPDPPKPPALSAAECAKDLSCVGEKHAIHASVYCKDKIEAHAAHDVKWSDGMLTPAMSRYRWGNKEHTAITYIGDKVAFQNGFGAFTPMTYFCTVDATTDAILKVEVIEGRIPSD